MYKLKSSTRKDKKWMVITPENKKIHFGAKGYEDYTIHKDKERKNRYVTRHKAKENWNKSGINTAGFWSYWILWNKPSLEDSIQFTEKKFKINVIF